MAPLTQLLFCAYYIGHVTLSYNPLEYLLAELEAHQKWATIQSFLCDRFVPHTTLPIGSEKQYHDHSCLNMNEKYLIHVDYTIQNDSQSFVYYTHFEYQALHWPSNGDYHTLCLHYNFSASLTINHASQCIESIQVQSYSIFPIYSNLIIQSK